MIALLGAPKFPCATNSFSGNSLFQFFGLRGLPASYTLVFV
jgi:hypothetical protein